MARPHPALVPLAAGTAPAALNLGDAEALLASAVDHGMAGLLWDHVRDAEPDWPARLRLAGIDTATRHRHGRIERALIDARDRLAAIGVEVAAVKGVVAEARWYGRSGARPCHDVDLLVGPAAIGRADEIVAAIDPRHPLCGRVGDFAASGVLPSVTLRGDGAAIDLHFDLLKTGLTPRSRELVWSQTEPWILGDGSTVWTLDPATALVHFLVHATKDGFPRLLGYADVARVLGDDDLDWVAVERLVDTEGLRTIAVGALDTVTDTLGLPRSPLRGASRTRARLWHAVWPASHTLLGSAGTARSRRQDLLPYLADGRTRDALVATRTALFPPAAAVAARYPDLPGPTPLRLARGRIRTWRERRTALRARVGTGPVAEPEAPGEPGGAAAPPEAPTDAAVTARLLRARLAREPVWLDVAGVSMGRTIPDGARVQVVPAGAPRRGEIWAFRNARGQLVVHRYRRRVGDRLRFQGDTRTEPDDLVPADWLIGRVVAVAPDGEPPGTPPAGPWAGARQRVPRVARARASRIVRRTGRPPGTPL